MCVVVSTVDMYDKGGMSLYERFDYWTEG